MSADASRATAPSDAGASLNEYDPQAFFATPIPPHVTHGANPVPVTTLYERPVGTFVENLCVARDGAVYLSALSRHAVERYVDGAVSTFAQFETPTLSMFEVGGGGLAVFTGEIGAPPFELSIVREGERTTVARLGDALFLNGSAPFVRGSALVVDSLAATIFHVELATGTVTPWLKHDILGKTTGERMLPAANGLKIRGRTAYVTNTERAVLLAIDFDANGKPSEPRILESDLRGDDFAFDVDGAAYITTHIHNTVMRLGRDGSRTDLAGPAHGAAGATAAAFGRGTGDATRLFVTTTGGAIAPYRGVPQTAKLLALDVGVRGHAIDFAEGA
jgi:hypothetical protein